MNLLTLLRYGMITEVLYRRGVPPQPAIRHKRVRKQTHRLNEMSKTSLEKDG